MLQVITGVPGASKTAYVVTKLDEIERKNKVNLIKNKVIFEHNKSLFDKFREDFTYRIYESGSAHELKTNLEVLPNDYFDFIMQDFDDLRPDYYFQRTTYYNEIIERINDREGHQAFEFLQPVRTIYSNINALKIDYTRSLILDWRDAPDGSIFAIDEVQNVEPYNTERPKKEPIVSDLTIHRHRGFDFYFITQFPTFLNTFIQNLCSLHCHITRPFGRTPRVYQYGTIKLYPGSPLNKFNCESKFSFKPADRIFKLYKSTTINTHEKRMPAGIKLAIPALLVCGGIFYWGYSDKQAAKKMTASQTSVSASNNSNSAVASNGSNASNSAVASDPVASYDPTKPYDFKPVVVEQEIRNKPKFSGCMKMGKKYVAYTEQGTVLDVDASVCKRLLEKNERPYDYFSERDKPVPVASSSPVQKNDTVVVQKEEFSIPHKDHEFSNYHNVLPDYK